MTSPRKRRAAATAGGKRNQQSKSSRRTREETAGSLELSRPEPPPPPPSSLVRLIQKDSAVLEYFQALQSNLDFDVQKWKTRARAYEQEKEALQRELDALKQKPSGGASAREDPYKDAVDELPPTSIRPDSLRVDPDKDPDMSRKSDALERKPISQATPLPVENDDFELEFSSSSSEDEDENEKVAPATGRESGRHVDSSFGIHKMSNRLDLSFSSSEEENDEGGEADIRTPSSEPLKASSHRPRLAANVQLAVDQLTYAFETLQDLGIVLVEMEELMEESSGGNAAPRSTMPSLNQTPQHASETVGTGPSSDGEGAPRRYRPRQRPDQDVAIDILRFIRALAHIKHLPSREAKEGTPLQVQTYYYPFVTRDMIPCYMAPENASNPSAASNNETAPADHHPAVAGVEKLLMCLCYMDVFCPIVDRLPDLPDTEKDLNGPGQDLQRILVGMRGRKAFASNLLQSLEGEIASTWVVQDRATRLLTTASHYSVESEGAPQNSKSKYDNTTENEELQMGPSKDGIPFGSKNFVRLAALVERCILAKLVATLYLFRQDYSNAFRSLWSYILEACPALALEDHPKLPPVLSFCVLEAILMACPPKCNATMIQAPTLLDWTIQHYTLKPQGCDRILELVLESTAGIYQARSGNHLDDRIIDLSRVEMAAFQRLKTLLEWSQNKNAPIDLNAVDLMLSEMPKREHGGKDERRLEPATLALVLQGDARKVDDRFQENLSGLRASTTNLEAVWAQQGYLLACTAAKKQLEIRQLEEYRRVVRTPMVFSPCRTGDSNIQSYSKDWINWIVQQELESVATMIVSAFRCCQSCCDADSLFRLVRWTISQFNGDADLDAAHYDILDTVEAMSHGVPVRVINLERRPDRLASFLSQALVEGLLIFKGVASLAPDAVENDNSFPPEGYFGSFAVDGEGKAAEVERRLVRFVGGRQADLNALVETHWIPNELKPFDSEAPDKDDMVRISPSEKACALSHIACWKGVERSLSLNETAAGASSIFRKPSVMRQRFLISGYASGPSLFSAKDDRDPVPVCVVLEDDAILVDRFTDRLLSLLEELPRDFHFCSLGYSRPKTAPLIPYSSQIGVPTSIWYLTGYILSLEGARYLLNKLPVRGPIDSWIGLAMFTNNWDNVFGNAFGVGVSSKPPQDPTISKDDLRRILRFRAFAASVPLCSQKVGSGTELSSTTGRNWRQRDTDIVYSGNLL